jgi:hypothetical protein
VVRKLLIVVALLVACGGGPPMRVVSRGTLAYAAAWHGEKLITIELVEKFQLVVRDGPSLREVARIELGPPEVDLPALAVSGDVALVGGKDGWIRRIDLAARKELDRWPQGAPVTALAATADHVVAGDATGVVCLRRTTGELLQCLAAGTTAITRIAIDATGDRATIRAGTHTRVLAIPSLAAVDDPGVGMTWNGGAVRWRDRAVVWTGPHGNRNLATLAGPVRAVAASNGGKLAIAGWVHTLDQPSVVVWTAPPR